MSAGLQSLRERVPARAGWYLVLLAFLAIVYGPALGPGLHQGRFPVIAAGQRAAAGDLVRALTGNVGFYRPLVTLTFALDYALCGVEPICYGLTNFALLVGCILGVGARSAARSAHPRVPFVAVAIWSLDFHGIGALLWTSGRTSLLLAARHREPGLPTRDHLPQARATRPSSDGTRDDADGRRAS